jgi:hypothetical protein
MGKDLLGLVWTDFHMDNFLMRPIYAHSLSSIKLPQSSATLTDRRPLAAFRRAPVPQKFLLRRLFSPLTYRARARKVWACSAARP